MPDGAVSREAVVMITTEEAEELSLTEQELAAVIAAPRVRLRSTRPGPRVLMQYPPIADEDAHTIYAGTPTDLRIVFEESMAPVDMSTLRVRARARTSSQNSRPDVLQVWLARLSGIGGVARATSGISRLRARRRCGADGMREWEVALARTLSIVVSATVVLVGCQSQQVGAPPTPGEAGARDAVLLITTEEAEELSLTEQELAALIAVPRIRLRSTRPGPRVVLQFPPIVDEDARTIYAGTPTDLRIVFEESLAPVDMSTLQVKARKGVLSKSITKRVQPFIEGTTIAAEEVEFPKGRFRIEVSIADAEGTRTVEEYRLIVADTK